MKSLKRYLLLLTAQFLICAAMAAAIYLLLPVRIVFSVLIYAGMPLLSAITAFRLVRKGINAYLAWVMPPVAQTAAAFLISMGYAPYALPVMITSFIALIGAATGDVKNKMNKRKH